MHQRQGTLCKYATASVDTPPRNVDLAGTPDAEKKSNSDWVPGYCKNVHTVRNLRKNVVFWIEHYYAEFIALTVFYTLLDMSDRHTSNNQRVYGGK